MLKGNYEIEKVTWGIRGTKKVEEGYWQILNSTHYFPNRHFETLLLQKLPKIYLYTYVKSVGMQSLCNGKTIAIRDTRG